MELMSVTKISSPSHASELWSEIVDVLTGAVDCGCPTSDSYASCVRNTFRHQGLRCLEHLGPTWARMLDWVMAVRLALRVGKIATESDYNEDP